MRRRAIAALLVAVPFAGCGDDDPPPAPAVDLIDDAIAAVEEHYGGPQDYFEISVDLTEVGFVVARDEATRAERGAYDVGGRFTPPEPVGGASGATFSSDAITFDRAAIFTELRDELDDPVIVDFAITGGPDGAAVYDATVASDAGGVILVLLGPDGSILGAQAQ